MKALITGASSGIGRDMAFEFAERGYDLVLAARRTERLLEIKDKVNTNVTVITADLSNEDDVRRLFGEAGDVDVLVNNAGFGVFGNFEETNLDRELEMLHVNIRALHMLMKFYIKEFEKRGSGKILNVASSAAFCPGPMFSSYYASKAYVYRLTLAVDRELRCKKSPVSISVLCPGPVNTEFDKVAKVSFGIGSLESKYVAGYAVEKFLKGKTVIVPGFSIKLARFFAGICPERLACLVTHRLQKHKTAG